MFDHRRVHAAFVLTQFVFGALVMFVGRFDFIMLGGQGFGRRLQGRESPVRQVTHITGFQVQLAAQPRRFPADRLANRFHFSAQPLGLAFQRLDPGQVLAHGIDTGGLGPQCAIDGQFIGFLFDGFAVLFDRYFAVPEIPDWLSKLSFFTQICDITFADAVRREGYVSEQRQTEAEALCRTYLSFHLPAWLPPRT